MFPRYQLLINEEKKSLFAKAWIAYNEKGVRYVLMSGINLISRRYRFHLEYIYNKYFFNKYILNNFYVSGRKYKYFISPYNQTWRNERSVEIPIICKVLKKYRNKNVLEIGNVLSHYENNIDHCVLDKYEIAPDVINQDIVNYQPVERYDLIISISTLEHIGFDEYPVDPTKIIRALNNIRNLLSPSGKAIFTIPLAYNKNLDNLLIENEMHLTKKCFLKRIDYHRWKQVEIDELNGIKYGEPFPCANGIVIGIMDSTQKFI